MTCDFALASPADLLKADERDDHHCEMFHKRVVSGVQTVLGPRFLMRYQRDVAAATKVAYYGLTLLSPGGQSLGEEYTDVARIVSPYGVRPTAWSTLSWILVHVAVPHLGRRYGRSLWARFAADTGASAGVSACADNVVRHAHDLTSLVHDAHRGIFFLVQGAYANIPERLLGIQKVFRRQPPRQRPEYQALGLLVLLRVLVRSVQLVASMRAQHASTEDGVSAKVSPALRGVVLRDVCGERGDPAADDTDDSGSDDVFAAPDCALCLRPRHQVTATPCGHLFCWGCIVEWCQNKPECPLCRQDATPASLLHLVNYT